MIVDDEASTRTGLRDYFDWASYGIEVVGEAGDGAAGLELARKLKPHIVLTDVKMPKLNGIEFARRLKEQDEKVKIVFISGYDDVDYLKSALKMDAVDYILKPVNRNEISLVFDKVVKLADSEKNQRELLSKMSAKLQRSIPLLRERFLLRLLKEGSGNGGDLEGQIEFLELNLPLEGVYCTIIISIDDQEILFESLSVREVELTTFSIQNICQEIVSRYMQGYVFEYRKGEFAAILCMPEEEAEKDVLYEMLADIKSSLDDFLQRLMNISISIGVGSTVTRLKELNQSCSHAEDALHQKLFLGKNQLILIDQLEMPGDWDFRTVRRKCDKLPSLLKASDESVIAAYLDELFGELTRNRTLTAKYCRMICQELLLLASQFLLNLELQEEQLDDMEERVRNDVMKLETAGEMKAALLAYLQQACRYIGDRKTNKSRNVIERIKSMIETRFQENVTISDIAKEVYLTTTYVCLIFKQETGMTLNDYLTKVRMETALDMLKDPANKLHDICYAIGYSEPSYFSKMFKKYTGLSPSEYRNMH
jgi:two-component system response regulator YesN